MKIRYTLLFLLSLYLLAPFASGLQIEDYVTSKISVQISGEVEQDVVIDLEPYSTIQDALEYVTLTENADLSQVNLNTVLTDKDVIVVPTKSEDKLVSINFSDLEELTTLPGIGPSIGQRIIDYRQTYGLFKTLEDLKNVKGIGDKTFEKLKDLISL